ncbi:hypothetical protein FJM67_12645 [Maribrevibacterium harenarium]|uniref:Uncharacterized protein n=1 Tax=Maribrevibacterium harenarium TaxID=2589817 RepID=A0A501WKT2_9GAMM|nr:hypothetical protein [Maribrevibacterium harenarium]TPE49035.1 hypothetical protein FJM67_12645 [Maribrevibacterium harenarium]
MKQCRSLDNYDEYVGLLELVIQNFNRLREYTKRKDFSVEAEKYCLSLRFIAFKLNILSINNEGKRIIIDHKEGVNRFTISDSVVMDKIFSDYIVRLVDFSMDTVSGRDKLNMNLLPGEAFINNEEYMNADF